MNFKLRLDITPSKLLSNSRHDRLNYVQVSYSLNFGLTYNSLYNTGNYDLDKAIEECNRVIERRKFTDKKSVIAYLKLQNKELQEFLKPKTIQIV